MKTVKSFEESCLLIKGVSETIQDEPKEQKSEFLRILLGTLGANLLTGKEVMKPDEGTIRAGQSF